MVSLESSAKLLKNFSSLKAIINNHFQKIEEKETLPILFYETGINLTKRNQTTSTKKKRKLQSNLSHKYRG